MFFDQLNVVDTSKLQELSVLLTNQRESKGNESDGQQETLLMSFLRKPLR